MNVNTPAALELRSAASRRPSADRNGGEDGEGLAPWSTLNEVDLRDPVPRVADAPTADDGPSSVPRSGPPTDGMPFDLPAFLRMLPPSGADSAVTTGHAPVVVDAERRPDVDPVAGPTVAVRRSREAGAGEALRLPAFLGRVEDPSAAALATTGSAEAARSDGPTVIEPSVGAVDALRATPQSSLAMRLVHPLDGSVTGMRKPAFVGISAADAAPQTTSMSARPSSDAGQGPPMGDPRSAARPESMRAGERRGPDPRGNTILKSLDAARPTVAIGGGSAHAAQSIPQFPVALADPSLSPGGLQTSASASGLGADALASRQEATPGLSDVPVGTEEWRDGLSAQLAVMADEGRESVAVIRLSPEELGELEIRVSVHEGEAAVQFGAANLEVRQAIEAAQARLREMFANQGMGVREFSVFNDLSQDPNASSSKRDRSTRTPPSDKTVRGDLPIIVTARDPKGMIDLYA